MQNHLAFDKFKDLLAIEKFDYIIEIGTANGGLTVFLNEIKSDTTELHSFDIRLPSHFNENLFKGINLHILSVFSEEGESIIKELISKGRCLILCDGGNKVNEFNHFSQLIKPGDMIMAHDYCDTVENFNNKIKGKYWDWHEIKDDQIKDGLSHVSKYNKVDFTYAVWLCCIK
jgi:hypothetical protein